MKKHDADRYCIRNMVLVFSPVDDSEIFTIASFLNGEKY